MTDQFQQIGRIRQSDRGAVILGEAKNPSWRDDGFLASLCSQTSAGRGRERPFTAATLQPGQCTRADLQTQPSRAQNDRSHQPPDDRALAASPPEVLPLSNNDRHLTIASTVPRITQALAMQLAPPREAAPHPGATWLQVESRDGRYEVRQDGQTIGTSECWLETTDLIRREVRHRLIADHPGLLWLHAGAAAHDGVAVLIVGGPGRGKSTLVTSLYHLGWDYLSDDLIAIDPATDRARAVPETPSFRQDPGHWLPAEEIDMLPKLVVDIAAARVCRDAIPIGAIIFPCYQPAAPTVLIPRRPSAAALGLFEHCFALATHHQVAVPYLARLAQRVPAFDLPYADGDEAAELIIQQG